MKLEPSARTFNFTTTVSLVLACFTLFLYESSRTDPPIDRIALNEHFHIGVWEGFAGDSLGMLVFFNNAQYGPYRGSIISLSDGKEPPRQMRGWFGQRYGIGQITEFNRNGQVELVKKECDMPGIYFRHFRWPDHTLPLWTLMVSLWYPLFLFSILPVVWVIRRWWRRGYQPLPA